MITLLNFLAIVGEPLESLHVPLLPITVDQLASILTYCPNLTELNISGHRMRSLAPLRDAYANHTCHISTLSLARTDVRCLSGTTNDDMDTILRGPGRNIIRQLLVHLLPPNWSEEEWRAEYIEDEIKPFLQDVSTAHHLEFVQLPGVGYCKSEAEMIRSYDDHGTPAFQATCHLPIDLSAHPFTFSSMSITNRLAFLSCLTDDKNAGARTRLDTSVLSLILQFAANTIPRRVVLHSYPALERCTSCSWRPFRV